MGCEGEEERWVCVVKERKRGGCVVKERCVGVCVCMTNAILLQLSIVFG